MRKAVRLSFKSPRIGPILVPFALACALALAVFVAGDAFSSFTTYTDGLTYVAAYELIVGESIGNAYIAFTLTTGSAEPLSFFVLYLFSQAVDLPTANNLLNLALLLVLFHYLRSKAANLWCWAPFVLTNYYLLLVGFGALRLKIALLLLVLSWLIHEQRLRWTLSFGAVLAHFQMFIPLTVLLGYDLLKRRPSTSVKYAAFVAVGLLIIQFDALLQKILYYAESGFAPPYKLLALFLVSLVLIDRRKMVLVMFALFFPISLMIGEGRLNIVYFLLIINEYLSQSKRTVKKNLVLALCGAYLSFKGIDFAISLVNGYSYFEG